MLSDLHNKEYGKNDDELVSIIKEQQPDFIVATGDLVIRNYINDDNIKNVLSQLSKTAPDYDTPESHFRDKFKNDSKSCYSILLHHQPEYIKDILGSSDIELILCDHIHVGLVRIPLIGGVVVPNQGLFPNTIKADLILTIQP